MLLKLFRAEIAKISRNYPVTCCLIWVWPALPIGLTLFLLALAALSSSARVGLEEGSYEWTGAMLGAWNIPNNVIGRLVLMGFVAVLFGGEYQWNTWKSIVPRSQRVALIVVKFLSLGFFVVLAFVLTSFLFGLGFGIITQVVGATYGPPLETETLRDFGRDYLIQMSVTFITVVISSAYVAFAAMLTRSILGSIIGGVVTYLVEGFSIIGLVLFAALTNLENVLHLYRITPTYNLLNVARWLNEGLATDFEVKGQQVNDPLGLSLVILMLWVVGLVSLTAYFFQRQDIIN